MKIIDISRLIARGEATYPGNPGPVLKRIRTIARDMVNNSQISLGLHTATHLDTPLHHLRKGKAADRIELERCMGWCRVIDLEKIKKEITAADVRRIKPEPGEIILFRTRNSRPSKKFNKNYIYVNDEAARLLAKAKLKAVGTDALGIKKFRLRPDRVHPVLLGAGVLIYEGLQLRHVKGGNYFFIGLPLKIVDAEASPVRAILIKA